MKKSIIRVALITAVLLSIPLSIKLFNVLIIDPGSGPEKLGWSLFDFIFAGVLIFGAGLSFELIIRKYKLMTYRFAVGIALAAVFLMVWINGAVGIIGGENNPANQLYLAALAVGLAATILSRLQPLRTAKAMFITAATIIVVPFIAFIIWQQEIYSIGARIDIVKPLVLTGFFALMFAFSGFLFLRTARKL